MRALLAVLAFSVAAGCSATADRTSTAAGTGTGTGTGTGVGGASSGSAGTGGLAVGTASTGSGTGGGMEIAEVFGHSADTLYKLDPNTKVVTTVGQFQGCGTVIDIALDKSGNMFATADIGVYRVDKTSAVCTLISPGSYPNSLSFVPAGTLDPNVEALVGYEGSTYVRIDTTTGKLSHVGSLGNSGYQSSGDVVSVIGGGTYLTVNGNGCGDCIVEVDPKTGALKQMIGPLGHAEVYGLAFWGGSAYGFDNYGELFQIDLTSGTSTIIDIPGAPQDLSFYGAGSTTSAPLTPTQ